MRPMLSSVLRVSRSTFGFKMLCKLNLRTTPVGLAWLWVCFGRGSERCPLTAVALALVLFLFRTLGAFTRCARGPASSCCLNEAPGADWRTGKGRVGKGASRAAVG